MPPKRLTSTWSRLSQPTTPTRQWPQSVFEDRSRCHVTICQPVGMGPVARGRAWSLLLGPWRHDLDCTRLWHELGFAFCGVIRPEPTVLCLCDTSSRGAPPPWPNRSRPTRLPAGPLNPSRWSWRSITNPVTFKGFALDRTWVAAARTQDVSVRVAAPSTPPEEAALSEIADPRPHLRGQQTFMRA